MIPNKLWRNRDELLEDFGNLFLVYHLDSCHLVCRNEEIDMKLFVLVICVLLDNGFHVVDTISDAPYRTISECQAAAEHPAVVESWLHGVYKDKEGAVLLCLPVWK